MVSGAKGPGSLTGLVARLGPRARAATVLQAATAGDVATAVPERTVRQFAATLARLRAAGRRTEMEQTA